MQPVLPWEFSSTVPRWVPQDALLALISSKFSVSCIRVPGGGQLVGSAEVLCPGLGQRWTAHSWLASPQSDVWLLLAEGEGVLSRQNNGPAPPHSNQMSSVTWGGSATHPSLSWLWESQAHLFKPLIMDTLKINKRRHTVK